MSSPQPSSPSPNADSAPRPAAPWEAMHRQAVEAGRMFYIDPASGYQVWTELHHLERGHCCQCGCRHCPYGFTR